MNAQKRRDLWVEHAVKFLDTEQVSLKQALKQIRSLKRNSKKGLRMNRQMLREKLDGCLQQLGLQAKMLKHCDRRNVAFSALYNDQNQEVSAGSGNGFISQEKSLAECIEHYFFLNSHTYYNEKPLRQISSQPGFHKDGVLSRLKADQVLAVVPFDLLNDSNAQVWVPLDYISRRQSNLSIPQLKKLCSSSGYSFHQSREEALVHGLLEVIERHDYSQVLIGQQAAYQVPLESLTANQKTQISRMESEFSGDIKLIVLRSQFQVWTSIVIFYPKSAIFPIPQTAQKSRLDLGSSIDGALNEMQQILYLYSSEERGEDLQVLENPRLKNHPAIHLEGFRTLPQLETEMNWQMPEHMKSTRETLKHLVRTVTENGYQPYGRTVFEFKNGCFVTQVFVPGFEKFNLIRLGVEVPTHHRK